MPPPPHLLDNIRTPEGVSCNSPSQDSKPPLPTLQSRASQQSALWTEVKLPPLIAGSLSGAFSKAVAHVLENELLAHYYLDEPKFPVNLDRVLDRLLADFTGHLWDELYQFYRGPGTEPSRQVRLLFDGPIRQIILILNGPEVSKCILDKLAPGLSQRKASWSDSSGGMDLPSALQLLCRYWHREMASQWPEGSPEEIARDLHAQIMTGHSVEGLIDAIRRVLMTPHYVQVHINESAMWNVLLKRPFPPPSDGYHVVHFQFDCQLFGPLDGIADPQLVNIGSLPAITGTAEECVYTSVSEYIDKAWPRHGSKVLKCLEGAVASACTSCQAGEPMSGLSIWSGSDENQDDDVDEDVDEDVDGDEDEDGYVDGEGDGDGDGHLSRRSGLRLVHVKVENAAIRLTVSSRPHTMIEIFQQMCWLCAALSASPFAGALSECTTSVSDWTYTNDAVHVNCSLEHRRVPDDEGAPWLRPLQGAAIARGFPIGGVASTQW
ncbi:hypothetical protein E4U43_000565 [Claviceps pusilla]|uniref:Uncharacterized protein n=1 Tax=Claviceps pusilla TaxID=123648 RepID=A0A9P7SYZ8_9HYPO|nr:hypothetical protein E4U43_000565 [Claviceps pusilla]